MQDSGDTLGLGITRPGPRGHAALRQHQPPDGRPDHRLGRLRPVRADRTASRRWSSRPAPAPCILDSATALFSPRPPPEALRSHFFQLVYALRTLGLTVGHPRRSARRLRPADDDGGRGLRLRPDASSCATSSTAAAAAARSKSTSTAAARTTRASTPARSRRAASPSSRSTRKETAGHGKTSSATRAASQGLDEMTHGGWLRNSIIIVRGPTGSGKTMLAGLYARAGAVARRARRLLRVRGDAPDPAAQLSRDRDVDGAVRSRAAP